MSIEPEAHKLSLSLKAAQEKKVPKESAKVTKSGKTKIVKKTTKKDKKVTKDKSASKKGEK